MNPRLLLKLMGLDPELVQTVLEKIAAEFATFNGHQRQMLRKLDVIEARVLSVQTAIADDASGFKPAGALNDDLLVARFFTGQAGNPPQPSVEGGHG